MLIRQKAGWRLHHQSYLWPRRSRTSPLSSTSLLLPRRRRSGTSRVPAHSVEDVPTSPMSLRRSSSGSSFIEGDDTSPSSPTSSSSRSRKCSSEVMDTPSPSSTSSSSPRKRKSSSSAELHIEELFSPCSTSLSAGGSSRSSSISSDVILEDKSTQLACKRSRRSSGSVASCNGLGETMTVTTGINIFHLSELKDSDVGTHFRTSSEIRSESSSASLRTRRDTRNGDSRGVESASSNSSSSSSSSCSLSQFSSLKGNNIGSGNNNNNHLLHCGSNYTSSSLKESSHIRESHPRSTISGSCSRTAKMGVLCTEKHDMGERCECEGMSASSPRPATLHSYPSSPCESNSQDSLKHAMSRKRSLDASIHDAADDTGTLRRRTQRSPSVGSINGVVGHLANKEKISSDIASVLGQNGFKRESGLNGLKMPHSYQNGTRPLCCLGLVMKEACSKCVAHHHPAVTDISLSSSSPTLTSSASLSCQNGRDITHSQGLVGTGAPSHSTSTSVFSVGSLAHPVTDDTNSTKRPQPPSSLLPLSNSLLTSSAAATSSQQQQLHQPTQGLISSNLGSSNNSSNSDDNDDCIEGTAVTTSSRYISASPNPTVLSLRQRPLLSNNTQKSLSQPASPQTLTSSFKSKPLLSSSSLPSLSTLVTEPSSPVTPSAVQCRWRGCTCGLDASDLLEHIRKHVESQIEKKTYACLWADCKVYNKPSWSDSWLERHIVSHSGHRPFKCILDNCGQRFHSQAALERHVNGHFAVTTQNGAKSGRTKEDISHRMFQRRKRQLKRRFVQTVKRNDFFDEQTMAVIKHELVSLTEQTALDLTGNVLHTTFQGLIVGRNSSKSGCKQSLVEFIPRDVLEDKWSPEEDAQHMCKMYMPLSCLPNDTVTNLHNSFYRQHRFRKHRRK